MGTVIKKIWSIGWRAVCCLFALSVIVIAVLSSQLYWKQINRSHREKTLSRDVCVYDFYGRNEKRIYNEATGRYTAKGIQWVADAPKSDSLTVFCRGGKRGFLNVYNGEVAIPEQYRRAWVFSEGMAAVMKDGKIGFINADNEVVLPFVYDYADRNGWAIDYLFRDGYCTMTDSRGACGLIDRNGRWAIEARYDCIWPPHDGKYRIVKEGEKYGLLDENLTFVFPIEYDYIDYAGDRGVLLTKDGYKWQADYDGTVIFPFVCDGTLYLSYTDGYNEDGNPIEIMSPYLTYNVYGCYGVIRKDNGKVVIPAIYDQINMISPAMFEAYLADKDIWVLIDRDGTIVKP